MSEEHGMTDLHSCVPGKDVEHMPGDVKTHKPNAHENSIFIWKTKRIWNETKSTSQLSSNLLEKPKLLQLGNWNVEQILFFSH